LSQMPLVSVVIPTYNRAGIIGATIENLFQQTYSNIEVIVVDDGSTDNTKNVLASYKERIRWMSQPNAGPSGARNSGLAMAKGEIIAFQDSDDAWHPTKIERQVSLLERAGSSVPCCVCNIAFPFARAGAMTSFDNAPINPPYEEGLWTNVAEVLTTRFILFNQAAAVRRSVLDRIGGFDETLKYLEDYEFALRLASEGPWAFIRTPLVYYKDDSVNSWSEKALKEAVLLNECQVRLRANILRKLAENSNDTELRRLMEKQLKRAQNVLSGTKMTRSNSRSRRFLGSFYLQVERLKMAVDRRLPGYPKMKVRPIPEAPEGETGVSHDSDARSLGVPTL
jgi:glycosyltransferase involved in cell wall biosynthesis